MVFKKCLRPPKGGKQKKWSKWYKYIENNNEEVNLRFVHFIAL